jgi:precorrin-6A/cobalt-precorrin-6A reductase
MHHVLLLGGTTEASQMAQRLADLGIRAVFSYAGRTDSPVAQPLPTRIGGFGGISGLVSYLQAESITHVIDATHPFAVQMSHHAAAACAETGIPLMALQRAPWTPGPGDHWTEVASLEAAVTALPPAPTRIFLAIGRQNLPTFAAAPQHHYLLRLVDAPTAPLALPDATVILSRGPFGLDQDRELLKTHAIQIVIAKNSGGSGARAKLDAARELGLPVILINRPIAPDRPAVDSVDAVVDWLTHPTLRGV